MEFYIKKENALKEALESCGYQYEEVKEYAKLKKRFYFEEKVFQNSHSEYILHDKYKNQSFLLMKEYQINFIDKFEIKYEVYKNHLLNS